MKNCDPFVFGPLLAIDKIPRLSVTSVNKTFGRVKYKVITLAMEAPNRKFRGKQEAYHDDVPH
jgi:hypothetical protein